MEKSQATHYLTNLLNKTLRITTTDARLFVGEFKCTDSDLNIILSQTHEYRYPSSSTITNAITSTPISTPSAASTSSKTVKLDMTSRYLGLTVVPGKHITKIEVEKFASQFKGSGGDSILGSRDYL